MRLTITLAACATLALAACGAPADDTVDDAVPTADDTSAPVEPGAAPAPAPTGDSTTTPAPTPTPTATDTGGTASIPAAMRGRWGLVPADCTSTRGDNKGLIQVSAQDIRFYESLGRLGTVKERSADRIRANFAFTGEGMEWTRDMALTVQNGGNKLVRREYGAEAMAGALTYTKC